MALLDDLSDELDLAEANLVSSGYVGHTLTVSFSPMSISQARSDNRFSTRVDDVAKTIRGYIFEIHPQQSAPFKVRQIGVEE